jgi:small nuclear ribonucleoprotein (snRNP)-like protein
MSKEATPLRRSKVVVACLDGRRLKGHLHNLSTAINFFRLYPEEDSPENAGTEIKFEEIKAVFFVKDIDGDPKRHDSYEAHPHQHGRPLEVTFKDGEKIRGVSETFHREKVGFFLFPADPNGNNVRIFVVNRNIASVEPMQTAKPLAAAHHAS